MRPLHFFLVALALVTAGALLLSACDVPEDRSYLDGRACWAQHGDYTICYAKCAAMNPRYHTSAGICVRGVDEAASAHDKGEPKP